MILPPPCFTVLVPSEKLLSLRILLAAFMCQKLRSVEVCSPCSPVVSAPHRVSAAQRDHQVLDLLSH